MLWRLPQSPIQEPGVLATHGQSPYDVFSFAGHSHQETGVHWVFGLHWHSPSFMPTLRLHRSTVLGPRRLLTFTQYCTSVSPNTCVFHVTPLHAWWIDSVPSWLFFTCLFRLVVVEHVVSHVSSMVPGGVLYFNVAVHRLEACTCTAAGPLQVV
jgi:hypothetical protein